MPAAPEAMAFVESLVDKALKAAEKELDEDFTITKRTAETVRDAAMLAMCVGHVGLTVRLSVVRTVKADAFELTDCSNPDCSVPGCLGNRLMELARPQVEGQSFLDNRKYQIIIPHHKTAPKGIVMPPITIESPRLNRLLFIWQFFGRGKVSRRRHASAMR